MHSSERSLVSGGVVVALVLFAGSAGATPNFPGAIQEHLSLSGAPACTTCHVGTPARGTVNTAFGTTMRSRGLVAYDEASLDTALDALAAEQKDSDGDGTADIRELTDGTDPNAGAGGSGDPVPDYGCAAAPRRACSGSLLVALGALVTIARLVRRRTK